MGEYKFHIYPRIGLRGRRWYFRFVSPNNKIMFQSEGYTTKAKAEEAVRTIKWYAANARTHVSD